jgi:hypothetical protein
LIQHQETGLKARLHDIAGLAAALDDGFESGSFVDRMGAQARSDYLARFTPERNFADLMQAYEYAKGHG